jgi:hypothetical protein
MQSVGKMIQFFLRGRLILTLVTLMLISACCMGAFRVDPKRAEALVAQGVRCFSKTTTPVPYRLFETPSRQYACCLDDGAKICLFPEHIKRLSDIAAEGTHELTFLEKLVTDT